MSDSAAVKNHAAFIWSVADLLRGDYKQSEYGKVILPLTVLRRLDCVLEPTKAAVLDRAAKLSGQVENVEPVLCTVAGEQFYNISPLDFPRLLDDPGQHRRQPARLHRRVLARAPATSSTSSTSTPRSPASTRPTCSTWSSPSSPRSTSTPTRSRTSRWATSTRSSSGASPSCPTRRPVSTSPPARSSGSWSTCSSPTDDEVLTEARRRQHPLRPGVRNRRDAVGRRGLPARAEPRVLASRSSARSSTTRPTPSAAPT